MGLMTRLATTGPRPVPGTLPYRAFTRLTRAHVALYRATGGRIGGRMAGARMLLLHHVGRRTGQQRVTPLLYLPDGEDLVVVASMGGSPRHPAWYHNLAAAPETTVQVGSEVRRVRARTASDEERDRLWPRLVDMYAGYAVYERRAPERRIPVVVLEPAD